MHTLYTGERTLGSFYTSLRTIADPKDTRKTPDRHPTLFPVIPTDINV
jgi:hypothetical protein